MAHADRVRCHIFVKTVSRARLSLLDPTADIERSDEVENDERATSGRRAKKHLLRVISLVSLPVKSCVVQGRCEAMLVQMVV